MRATIKSDSANSLLSCSSTEIAPLKRLCVSTSAMKRNTQDLEEIAHLTLEHYNQHAEEFWQGTRDHDVSQNIATLLQCIRNEPPFKILDFGCGPGRDLTFAELGHIAIGLEGAVHLAVMARAHSGCEVWQQDFLKLDLPDNHFDGVFANAALFHVPSQELPRVLSELKASRKARYSSSRIAAAP
jgi:SAM-dependent methyltransferase